MWRKPDSAEICDRHEGSPEFAGASKLAGVGPDRLRHSEQLLEQPHMEKLKQMLEAGQVTRKMDWFDPTLLQQMVSGTLVSILCDPSICFLRKGLCHN